MRMRSQIDWNWSKWNYLFVHSFVSTFWTFKESVVSLLGIDIPGWWGWWNSDVWGAFWLVADARGEVVATDQVRKSRRNVLPCFSWMEWKLQVCKKTWEISEKGRRKEQCIYVYATMHYIQYISIWLLIMPLWWCCILLYRILEPEEYWINTWGGLFWSSPLKCHWKNKSNLPTTL